MLVTSGKQTTFQDTVLKNVAVYFDFDRFDCFCLSLFHLMHCSGFVLFAWVRVTHNHFQTRVSQD